MQIIKNSIKPYQQQSKFPEELVIPFYGYNVIYDTSKLSNELNKKFYKKAQELQRCKPSEPPAEYKLNNVIQGGLNEEAIKILVENANGILIPSDNSCESGWDQDCFIAVGDEAIPIELKSTQRDITRTVPCKKGYKNYKNVIDVERYLESKTDFLILSHIKKHGNIFTYTPYLLTNKEDLESCIKMNPDQNESQYIIDIESLLKPNKGLQLNEI